MNGLCRSGVWKMPAMSAASSSVSCLFDLLEVQPRRRLDAVGAVAEVHLVAVDREDLSLGVALLDLDREDDLAHLPLERLLVGQAELFLQVARQLLRERARALRAPALRRCRSTAATTMRQMLMPKCRSNSASSVAMIAWRRSGLMSS